MFYGFEGNLYTNCVSSVIDQLDKAKCSWDTPSSYDFLAQCNDLSYCNVKTDPSCCTKHGGRLKCPKNYPIMCAKKLCLNNTEHCCTGVQLNCGVDEAGYHGGPRSCGRKIPLS